MPSTIRQKVHGLAWLLLAYLLLVFIFYPGLFTEFSHKVPHGDSGDLKFILSIVDFSIHTELPNLYNFPIFYPESGSLARAHPLFGISIFYKAFQWAGLNLEQSTNLYIILGLIIGALGCFLLAREVSGNTPFSLAFSILYIVHRINFLHFIWLNFFSRFWVPYIFLMLLRYFRTGKQRYAAGAAALAFMEFFACIYLGTVVGIFLLPFFVLFAWLLRLINWRRLLILGGWFMLALVLIVIVFYPYLRQSRIYDQAGENPGVSPADMFVLAHWLEPLIHKSDVRSQALFPGMLALAGFVLFFVRVRPGRRLAVFLLLFAPVPVLMIMAFSPGPFMEVLFLIWMVMLAAALVQGWREFGGVERLMMLTFVFFVLVNLQFRFLPGLRSLSLVGMLFKILPPIRGLRMIERAFITVLPLFVVLAASGVARLPQMTGISLQPRFLAVILLFLVAIENIYLPNVFYPGRIMQAIPYRDIMVYRRIPFRSDQVVLEIPYYFGKAVRNSNYLLNWRFHQNYLLNGKGRVRPHRYWEKLASIIGKMQRGFPSDSQLRKLLHEYSVGWVIIHWKMLRKNQIKFFNRDLTWAKIQRLKKYGRIVTANANTVLIEVRELKPVREVVRTYSDFHLRRNILNIVLKSSLKEMPQTWLNGQPLDAPIYAENQLFLDLRHQPLRVTGNRVEVRFDRPLVVSAVRLRPEKTLPH